MDIDDRLLALNSSNASALRNRGVAFLQMGKAFNLKAKSASGETQLAQWRTARIWFQRSLEVWDDQQKKGTLVAGYLPQREEAIRAIAKCNLDIAAKQSN